MKFSIEAEQSVLGGLLIDPSRIDDVIEKISADDFYNNDNKIIFAMLADMAADGAAVDPVTISERLSEDGTLDAVGGFAFILELASNTPSASNIMAYAQIVADRSMERRILSAGMRLCEIGQEDGDVDEKLNLLHAELAKLERNDSVEIVDYDSIIKGCIKTLDDKNKGIFPEYTKTGLTAFDEKVQLQKNDLWIVGARPSMGKTAFAMNAATNVAMTGKHVIVFTMEMSKEQLVNRQLSAVSGLDADVIKSGKLEGDDWNKLSLGVAKLKGLKFHIIETPAIDINHCMAICRKIAKRHDVGMVVVDYIQLMTSRGNNRVDIISDVSRKLKVIAKTIQAPVLALSQLSRKVEERPNKRPILSDLRESGQIEQDGDIITFLYRDDYYNEDSANKNTAEVITRKYRDGEIGTVVLGTDFKRSRFIDIDYSNYRFDTEQDQKPYKKKSFD
jgi:replicative DNA helicase